MLFANKLEKARGEHMLRILLLTGGSEPPLPALGLLSHSVTNAPLAVESVAKNPGCDLVLIDGVSDIVGAKRIAGVFLAAKLPIPAILAISEASLPAVDGNWGVDDFVLNTASIGELDARIRRVIAISKTVRFEPTLSNSGITIDESSFQASASGRTLDLTFKEFELLRYLVGNPGRVFSREQLLSEVWGYDYFGGTRTVDVHIRRLRAKLGDHESIIGTVRNVGYRFAGEDEQK